MLSLLISLIIWGLILAIVWWAISQIPVPAPFSWVIRVVFALIVVIVLIDLLTGGLAIGSNLGFGEHRPLL
jgi:hypothetical protein